MGLSSLVGSAIANGHESVESITDVMLRVRDEMTSDEFDAIVPDRRAPAT